MRKTLGDIFKILAIAAVCIMAGFFILVKILALIPLEIKSIYG